MTEDPGTEQLRADIKASRFRVARSRGALSGLLLVILGLWAALIPFIGPYFNFAYTPAPNDAWKWTAARAYLEVLPGAAALLGGLLLLLSANRVTASFGAWLGIAGGAWLVVGPSLARPLHLHLGRPDPSSGTWVRALEELLFFYAIGAAILFFATAALGRLSIHSIRDVRAARRRTAAEEAEAARLERERRDGPSGASGSATQSAPQAAPQGTRQGGQQQGPPPAAPQGPPQQGQPSAQPSQPPYQPPPSQPPVNPNY